MFKKNLVGCKAHGVFVCCKVAKIRQIILKMLAFQNIELVGRGMASPRLDNLLDIAFSLNEAVLSQNMWGHALQGMADAFGGSFATFEIINKKTGRHLQHLDSSNVEIQSEYINHYMPLNPRVAFGGRPDSPIVLHDRLFIAERDMDRHEFYADFLRPFDLRYFLSLKAYETKDDIGVFTIQKHAAGGAATDSDISAIGHLAPILRNVAKFQVQQGQLFQRLNCLEELLNINEKGVVFLDEFGHINELNLAASKILALRDGLSYSDGKVSCPDTKAGKKLNQSLSQHGQNTLRGNQGCDILIPRRSGLPPYHVRVQNISKRNQDFAISQSTFLLIITDPSNVRSLEIQELCDGFGFSLAEANVALAISTGSTASEIAHDFGVSVSTIRTHIQHVMQKMSVNKQVDIARVITKYL